MQTTKHKVLNAQQSQMTENQLPVTVPELSQYDTVAQMLKYGYTHTTHGP